MAKKRKCPHTTIVKVRVIRVTKKRVTTKRHCSCGKIRMFTQKK